MVSFINVLLAKEDIDYTQNTFWMAFYLYLCP